MRKPKRRGPFKEKKVKKIKWWIPKGKVTVTSLIAKGHEPVCRCCRTTEKLTFDHVIPKSKGGKDTTENGQILCARCNRRKSNRKVTIIQLRKEITGIAETRTK
ncbi:HNH endonuclease signature motif containing protein [Tenacibaculum maritimum]|nr:HNH endonuclease signature motif containing protein [Tenacibaculum maritimum]